MAPFYKNKITGRLHIEVRGNILKRLVIEDQLEEELKELTANDFLPEDLYFDKIKDEDEDEDEYEYESNEPGKVALNNQELQELREKRFQELEEEFMDDPIKTSYLHYAKQILDIPVELIGLHPAEIAAMYNTSKQKTFGNSDEQILKDLRKDVFSVPLLQKDTVKDMFIKTDQIMYNTVYELLEVSDHYYEQLVQVVVKVAAGNTYGKNIYERDEKIKRTVAAGREIFKDHEIDFLKNSHNLLFLMSRNRKVNEIKKAAEQCNFIRGIYEEILHNFVKQTSGINTLYWMAIKHKCDNNHGEYVKLQDLIYTAEQKFRFKRVAFGLYNKSKHAYSMFKQVRSAVIAPYLRSVYSQAKNTAKNTHQMLDNFQNGAIGLMRAVSCYSTKRPASFASVAKWWVKQMMLLSIKEDANFVKLPVSTWQTYTQLEKVRLKHNISEDDFEKLAQMSKIPVKKIKSIYGTIRISQVYSLNKTYDNDEKLSLEDIMTEEDKLGYDNDDRPDLLREYCANAKLTDFEILVLVLRHGMTDLLKYKDVDANLIKQEAIIQNLAGLGYNYKPLHIKNI